MAAAFAVRGAVFISHQSAAALWRLLRPSAGDIHITVWGDAGRERRSGITIHRSATLIVRITTERFGIPVTNPARTLRDLRRNLPLPIYRRALRRALDQRLISSGELSEAELTRSELERIFLGLCRRHRLPPPEVNAVVGPFEVDFLWRDRGLIVETDGYRHHSDRSAFERDRARDVQLQALGFRVLRFTYRQVRDRQEVVTALRTLLGPVPLFD